MNETIITGLIAAAVSVMVALTTAAGEKRRGQIEAAKVSSDLDLRLAEREDKLRLQLWADIEEKLEKQRISIKELQGTVQAQAGQIHKLNEDNDKLRLTVGRQAVQIEKLLEENHNLKNGGASYTPASL